MFIKIANIFLSILLPLSVILVNNFSVINYYDLLSSLQIIIIFFAISLIPFFLNFFRKFKYDIFLSVFIILVVFISLLTINYLTFTYKQTLLIWVVCSMISYLVVHFKIIKNSFFLFIFLMVFTASSFGFFIINNFTNYNKENFDIKREDVFFEQNTIDIKSDKNFFFIVFDGFPRLKNLKKIGYDISKFETLFEKYDLFLFEKTKSSYLDTQKSMSSTMNMSLIRDDIKMDKKYFYKFIQNSLLLDIFIKNGYSINWFPNDLTLSSCPNFSKVKCYPGEHKLKIFNKEIVKYFFQMLLLQPYWIEKVNVFYINKIKNKKKILFNLDIVTNFVKNEKNLTNQFVFAHIMSPHPPYILDSNCSLQKFGLEYKLHDQKKFLEQVDCIYLQLETFLKEIKIKMPDTNLFIHSDHGTTLINTKIKYGDENFENFIVVNKSLLCNFESLKEKINLEILKNIMRCV